METAPLNEASAAGGGGGAYHTNDESAFICNICLEITNKDPVVTQCGHLYCWPCLYRWLNTQHTPCCPVCKAGVTRENVIPLFIRGAEADPRNKTPPPPSEGVPNRPSGRRPEPQHQGIPGLNTNGQFNAQFGGMSFSAGFGFFPSLFGLQFQSFAPMPPPPQDGQPMTQDQREQEFLSKLLLALGTLVVLGLLFF